MKIKITGINGYLGKLITMRLTADNHDVSGIKRELLYGKEKNLLNEISGCDIVINLAGASILRPWTAKNKRLIYDSRINTTKNLVAAINQLPAKERPKKFICASAIGIYTTGILHDEDSTNFESRFIGKVVKDWEDTLEQLPSSIQQTIFRIGLVLGKNAKTIANLLLPFKLGLGGKIGTGKQAFPFIHEKDLVNAFAWAVVDSPKSKVLNLVAPQNITNKEFTHALAHRLNRPAFIPVPAFAVKLILGKAATLLLESPIVAPKALLNTGFEFAYPNIDDALEEILA